MRLRKHDEGVEVHVDDVVTVRRKVRIPNQCPKCGAALIGGNKVIKCRSRQAVSHPVSVREDGSMDWGEPSWNEQPYQTRAWACLGCRYILAQADELAINDEFGPQAVVDLIDIAKRLERANRKGMERVAALMELKERHDGGNDDGED